MKMTSASEERCQTSLLFCCYPSLALLTPKFMTSSLNLPQIPFHHFFSHFLKTWMLWDINILLNDNDNKEHPVRVHLLVNIASGW